MVERKPQSFVTGGHLWGTERAAARISLRDLGDRAGVNKGTLSLMEHGRLIPTSDEYNRITVALRQLVAEKEGAA